TRCIAIKITPGNARVVTLDPIPFSFRSGAKQAPGNPDSAICTPRPECTKCKICAPRVHSLGADFYQAVNIQFVLAINRVEGKIMTETGQVVLQMHHNHQAVRVQPEP